jgi:peptide/nickel transport system substrate-binding protein
MPSSVAIVRALGLLKTWVALALLGLLGLGCKAERQSLAAEKTAAASVGGTLRVSVPWDVASFDVHGPSGPYAQWLGPLLFDYLVFLDGEGKPGPWLAKSWDVSPDGLTYTFHLREGVTFSDGSKFDAETVRLNLEHMRDPKTKSPLAGRYIAPYHHGEVLDQHTFRAHLSEPFSSFLDVLAQSWLAIYSPKAIRENAAELVTHPVGSGPFVLESFTRQRGLTLTRRADYAWAPPYFHHVGPALLARIEVDIVPEDFVRLGALAGGQHDLSLDVAPQNAAAIRQNSKLVFYNLVRKGVPTRPLTFNTERAPFDDVRVRRALALATDREGLSRLLGFGEYRAKTDYLAENTRGYDPSFQNVLRYDLGEANRWLDEAGWQERDSEGFRKKGGQRLGAEVLLSETITTPRASQVALQSEYKRVGFDLRIVALPLLEFTARRNSGNYQALATGYWQTNTPDGLFILHHSQEIISPTTLGQNLSRLRDPELDGLLLGARRATDPSLERTLYSEVQRRLLELVPSIPLHDNHNLVAASSRVRGLLFETSHQAVFLTATWLEAAE